MGTTEASASGSGHRMRSSASRAAPAAGRALWPGSLYCRLFVSAAQMNTSRLADPHETLRPSGDHAQRRRFFSKLWEWPVYVCAQGAGRRVERASDAQGGRRSEPGASRSSGHNAGSCVPFPHRDAAVLGGERLHVPGAERVVHGVGQQVLPVRRESQPLQVK